MKKILFITAFVPSRIAAGENYSRQLINDLANKNKVDVVFFKYSKNSEYTIESKNVNVVKTFNNSNFIKLINYLMLPFFFPLFVVRFNLFRLWEIRKILKMKDYDFILLDYSQTHLYGKFIKNYSIILMAHDVMTQRYSRIYLGLFSYFCRITEKFILNNKNGKVFTLNEKDQKLILNYFSIKSTVSNLFIDISVKRATPKQLDNYFVFFANWNRPDNFNGLIWFLKYVLPNLKKQMEFIVIGMGLDINNMLIKYPYSNIKYTGFIDDPYPIISNAKGLISPLFSGAGIKVKVVESLACGTPVIGTEISFEGLSNTFSNSLYCVNNPNEFISVLNDFNITLELKLNLKNKFMNYYKKSKISDYINTNGNEG